MKLKVLKSFPFKGQIYYKNGYIIKDKFTDIELDVLSQMGNIEYTAKKTKKAK